MWLRDLRPDDELAARYRAIGVWREQTPIDDLRRWRRERPADTAIVALGRDGRTRRIDYREYAELVERFASALRGLGVRRADVVALQLPNWWQVSVLALACARVGAVLAPIPTTAGPDELGGILARLEAGVLVTTSAMSSADHAAWARAVAPRLPRLRQLVVLGGAVGGSSEVDFAAHFERTPWEQMIPMPLDGARDAPDRIAFALPIAGARDGGATTAFHSFNTLHAALAADDRGAGGTERCGTRDAIFLAHPLTEAVGLVAGLLMPLRCGATAVLLDPCAPEKALPLMAETQTTLLAASPGFVGALVRAAQAEPEAAERLRALRAIRCGFGPLPERPLAAEVVDAFAVPLQAMWGTTEAPLATLTRIDDPPRWAAESVGRATPGTELDLRGAGLGTGPAQVFVRGAGVCLATMGRDRRELTVLAEHDGGWRASGHLAVEDGRGGIRIVGRSDDGDPPTSGPADAAP